MLALAGCGVAAGFAIVQLVLNAEKSAHSHDAASSSTAGKPPAPSLHGAASRPFTPPTRIAAAPSADPARSAVVPVSQQTPSQEPTLPETPPPVPAHEVVRRNFGSWISLAAEQGISVPRDFLLPAELHEEFARCFGEFEDARRAVEARRMPIVEQLRQLKERQGAYEEYQLHDSDDAAAEEAQRKALRQAKKPSAVNQTVITSGSGRVTRIIRVDPADHPDLPHIYFVFDGARRKYVEDFYMYLGPYLGR